ncbi:hypothetical protein [Mesorhizobium sp.]|uniref:hypothetical protein n=1 Tax=Mesorhizobium sp. TaxID=1871066 RepID=UPI00257F6D61|nr:hypothetical protein [Mesorhizobium sp.]
MITKLLSRTEFILTEKLPDGQTAVRMEDAAAPWPRMQSALSERMQVSPDSAQRGTVTRRYSIEKQTFEMGDRQHHS